MSALHAVVFDGRRTKTAYMQAGEQLRSQEEELAQLRSTITAQAEAIEQARLAIAVLIELDETDDQDWPSCLRAPVQMGRAWLAAHPEPARDDLAQKLQSAVDKHSALISEIE